MKLKLIKFTGSIIALLVAVSLHAQCDENTMNLEQVEQQLIDIFSNNLGQKSLGFQMSYKIQFEECKATVTKNADSKNKNGRPTIYSFNLHDLKGKNIKFYSVKKKSQLSIKIGKKINDSRKVQYITFTDVKDIELTNTLPKLISHAQCLCAKSN